MNNLQLYRVDLNIFHYHKKNIWIYKHEDEYYTTNKQLQYINDLNYIFLKKNIYQISNVSEKDLKKYSYLFENWEEALCLILKLNEFNSIFYEKELFFYKKNNSFLITTNFDKIYEIEIFIDKNSFICVFDKNDTFMASYVICKWLDYIFNFKYYKKIKINEIFFNGHIYLKTLLPIKDFLKFSQNENRLVFIFNKNIEKNFNNLLFDNKINVTNNFITL